MVLSLPFILAIVGAGVGLLVGILIFGEVSDAIQCPASGGGGGGGDIIIDTLALDDSVVDLGDLEDGNFGQLLTLNNQKVVSIILDDFPSTWASVNHGTITAKVWSGVSLGSSASTVEATSQTITHDNVLFGGNTPYGIDPNGFNGTFVFTTQPILSGSNIVIGFNFETNDDDTIVNTISTNVGGNEGIWVSEEGDHSGNWKINGINCFSTCPPSTSPLDMAVKIVITGNGGGGGGGSEVGAEQCQNAKDTAWTVIGIMPVALFFGLFALFGSFQRPT